MRIITLASIIMLTLTACGGSNHANFADSNATTSDVASRQALMKDWRSANDILKGMMENPANFDTALLQEQTQFLQDTSSEMWSYYNDSSATGNAKDTVWSDPTGFAEATANFDAAVMALNAAAQTATSPQDVERALGQVGEACGSCHKAYRR